MAGKKWTEAADKLADKKAGIKQGSPRDNALDRSRGVPVRKAPKGRKSSHSSAGARARAATLAIRIGTVSTAMC